VRSSFSFAGFKLASARAFPHRKHCGLSLPSLSVMKVKPKATQFSLYFLFYDLVRMAKISNLFTLPGYQPFKYF